MENKIDQNIELEDKTLKKWETPELSVSSIEDITEGGTFGSNPNGEDTSYTS